METIFAGNRIGGRLLRCLGLFSMIVLGVGVAQGQTVEEKLAALEARIQQLESELAATQGTETRVAAVEQSVAEIEESADFEGLSFFNGVRFSGMLDTYYGYDFNQPGSRTLDTRAFAVSHNSLALNLIELDIAKDASESDPLGYHLTFGYGLTSDLVNSGDPGTTGDNLFQYYLSGMVPGTGGLTIDVGKFVTQHGAEVIESSPNWNYTRGILFTWAIPFYHFGIRTTYPVSDTVTLAGYLVNGWNNVVDNNGGKTFGAQLIWAPNDNFSFVQNYMVGPEQDNENGNFRHLIDSIITVQLHEKVTFMTNFDYGTERSVGGASSHWIGTANYLRFQFTDRFALTPRFEYFSDPQGFATGTVQKWKEFTITPEIMITENLITRFEYRHDWSNSLFFADGDDATSSSQDTFTLGVMMNF